MSRTYSKKSILGLGLLALTIFASAAQAQVVIYRLKFQELPGSINFEFYEDGFLIAPALGGAASIVLATEENGLHLYAQADNAGRHFVTIGEGGNHANAIFSAFAESNSAEAYYLLSGNLNHTISGRSSVFEFTSKAAKKLVGYALASDDESQASQPAADGSIGYAGLAEVEANMLVNRTANANDRGLSVANATTELIALLTANGYIDEANADSATQSLDEAAFFIENGESGAASFDAVVNQAENGNNVTNPTTNNSVNGFSGGSVNNFTNP